MTLLLDLLIIVMGGVIYVLGRDAGLDLLGVLIIIIGVALAAPAYLETRRHEDDVLRRITEEWEHKKDSRT